MYCNKSRFLELSVCFYPLQINILQTVCRGSHTPDASPHRQGPHGGTGPTIPKTRKRRMAAGRVSQAVSHSYFQLRSQPLLLAFAGEHGYPPLLKGARTAAFTPKQGASLPRPQCSFLLPARSFQAERPEKADARHKACIRLRLSIKR